MSALFENMAFRGDWKPLFDFIANAVREQSRIREYILKVKRTLKASCLLI